MTYESLGFLVKKAKEIELMIVDEFLNTASDEEKQNIPTRRVSYSEFDFIEKHSIGLTFYMNAYDAKRGKVSTIHNTGCGWFLYKTIK